MKSLLAILTIAGAINSSLAAWFTNSVSADAFVRSNTPTLNYGGAGALTISGAAATNSSGVSNGIADTFIRFNTAAMVTNLNTSFGTKNWIINGVRLRVTEVAAPANAIFNRGKGAFEIRWISNDAWTEGTGTPAIPTTDGITYNDESLLLTNTASLGTFTNSGADGIESFVLSLPPSFVTDIAAGGEIGLFLSSTDPKIGFTFNARSFGSTNARPFLEISAISKPGIASFMVSETNVVIHATNGDAGETYLVLSTTNLFSPLNQWISIATNALDTGGNFDFAIPNAIPGATQQFFILQTQ
jgi:hypothetical protein